MKAWTNATADASRRVHDWTRQTPSYRRCVRASRWVLPPLTHLEAPRVGLVRGSEELPGLFGVTRQRANSLALREETLDDALADAAGRAGDEYGVF